METISFLLGSGFSAADGLPLVTKINNQLLDITEKDIYFHSDMTAVLLKGQKQPNVRPNYIDELFFVKFLNFYSTQIIDISEFNYEILFDDLVAYFRFGKFKDKIHFFCEEFRNNLEGYLYKNDDGNLLSNFKNYFIQIVSIFFQVPKYYEDVSLGNYPLYNDFTSFIRDLLKDSFVKVHTLNHDLLFEHLASKLTDLWQHFSDGFDELNSPYYGQVYINEVIHKTYKVRLKKFTDNFKSSIALFKLHGSIDTYIADITNEEQVRIKKDYGVSEISQEAYDQNTREYYYKSGLQNVYPDFLSGTTAKQTQYGNPYYENLINHFKTNLSNSKLLIVIGYGFKDDGINNILMQNYLAGGKKMVVIDIREPSSRLIKDFNVEMVEKPFIEVTYSQYQQFKNF